MTDLPDLIVEEALRVVIQFMPSLDDEQRMELLDRLFDGYCKHCGSKDTFYEGRRIYCQCRNDE